jgi:hypothetical protein
MAKVSVAEEPEQGNLPGCDQRHCSRKVRSGHSSGSIPRNAPPSDNALHSSSSRRCFAKRKSIKSSTSV